MSRSARQLDSLTTRDILYTRPRTLEFRAGRRWRDGAPACAVHTIVTTGSSASERL